MHAPHKGAHATCPPTKPNDGDIVSSLYSPVLVFPMFFTSSSTARSRSAAERGGCQYIRLSKECTAPDGWCPWSMLLPNRPSSTPHSSNPSPTGGWDSLQAISDATIAQSRTDGRSGQQRRPVAQPSSVCDGAMVASSRMDVSPSSSTVQGRAGLLASPHCT